MVTIFRAFNPAQAHLVHSRLEAAGFHPDIVNELSALSIEGYALSVGGILVQVPDEECAEAKIFLTESTDLPPDTKP